MNVKCKNTDLNLIFHEAKKGKGLSGKEALTLLYNIPVQGADFDRLLRTADVLSRKQFSNTGEVHAQIGLNWDKCHNNCQFCMFSETLNTITETKYLSVEEIIEKALEFEKLDVGSISLMSTADYDFERYLNIGYSVSKSLKNSTPLFGNWGDIDIYQARALKKAGFTYYYHALRLGEGRVTGISPETRIRTMENAHRAGLLVGSCLEPIGPEHTYEEMIGILDIMRDLNVSWMATMKRINVKGSPLNEFGEITDEEFAKITAVTRIFFGKRLFTMAAHEPKAICLRAGANFLVTEIGTNPRDHHMETSISRGYDVASCHNFLETNNYKVHKASVNKRYLLMSIKNRNFTHFKRLLLDQISVR